MGNGLYEETFYVSARRRFGVPAIFAVLSAVAALRGAQTADASMLRFGLILFLGAACLFFYYNATRLLVGAGGLCLCQPLQPDVCLKWDSIVRIRRSSAPPGSGYFLELIVSPSETMVFNPYLFDRPEAIIAHLEKRLETAFGDSGDQSLTMPAGSELAIVDEPPVSAGIGKSALYFIVLILIVLICFYFYR